MARSNICSLYPEEGFHPQDLDRVVVVDSALEPGQDLRLRQVYLQTVRICCINEALKNFRDVIERRPDKQDIVGASGI